MKTKMKYNAGVTLIEILLVLVIVSMFIYITTGYIQQKALQMRIDRASLQMQQVLNAGMSYYVANGSWPPYIQCLQGAATSGPCSVGYLPAPPNFEDPWGFDYQTFFTNSNFYVVGTISANTPAAANAIATNIAGKVPLAYVTSDTTGLNWGSTTPQMLPAQKVCTSDTVCYVFASVNIPGQNLNNASAVNFAGVYHHGACIPVPTCPIDANGNQMVPEVIVMPLSVSGVNDPGSSNAYPITSFTAYVLPNGTTPTTNSPPLCPNTAGAGQKISTGTANCTTGLAPANQQAQYYWRTCLQVVTQKGDVSQTNTDVNWGQKVTIGAFTRCVISGEASGSNYLSVWSN